MFCSKIEVCHVDQICCLVTCFSPQTLFPTMAFMSLGDMHHACDYQVMMRKLYTFTYFILPFCSLSWYLGCIVMLIRKSLRSEDWLTAYLCFCSFLLLQKSLMLLISPKDKKGL